MKLINNSFYALITIMSVSSCDQNMDREENVANIIGTWEYTGNRSGMAIFDDKNFIFFTMSKPDSLFGDSLTLDELRDRYNSINTTAGTYVIRDSLVTCTIKYAKTPNIRGNTFRWTYTLVGDSLHFKILDENGKVRNEGDCRRTGRE